MLVFATSTASLSRPIGPEETNDMKEFTRTAIGTLIVLSLAKPALLAETAPTTRSDTAAPLSAELAKTCRELAIKAHPTQRAGGSASAQAQRVYFQECVAKRGNMQN
jgi:hypothetical protein